jgi:hypothetical protein
MARDEFFAELFVKPERMEYSHHPSDRVLRAYLAGKLGDEWHFDQEFLPKLRRADLNGDWGLSEVSLHLLTCNLCCERVAKMRAEELEALERERGPIARLLGRVRRWLGLEGWAEWNRRLAERLGNLVALGISPFVLDLSLGTSAVSPISLGLLYQYARGGLEFQGGALIEDRGYEC